MELNHFYDRNGKEVFHQVIFEEKIPVEGYVRGWKLLKKNDSIHYYCGFHHFIYPDTVDGKDLYRHIRTKAFVETHTQFDPELWDREFLKKEDRKGLRK